MKTLDEAIKRYTDNAEYERTHGNLQGCLEFRQLAKWLKELKDYKDARVGCEYCKHNYREQHERPCSLCRRNFMDMFESEVNADDGDSD